LTAAIEIVVGASGCAVTASTTIATPAAVSVLAPRGCGPATTTRTTRSAATTAPVLECSARQAGEADSAVTADASLPTIAGATGVAAHPTGPGLSSSAGRAADTPSTATTPIGSDTSTAKSSLASSAAITTVTTVTIFAVTDRIAAAPALTTYSAVPTEAAGRVVPTHATSATSAAVTAVTPLTRSACSS
jgi:hypothetical protein